MSLAARLGKLEAATGAAAECRCGRPRVVYVNDWRQPSDRVDPGPELCPKCGRPRAAFQIEYVTDWRGESSGSDPTTLEV